MTLDERLLNAGFTRIITTTRDHDDVKYVLIIGEFKEVVITAYHDHSYDFRSETSIHDHSGDLVPAESVSSRGLTESQLIDTLSRNGVQL